MNSCALTTTNRILGRQFPRRVGNSGRSAVTWRFSSPRIWAVWSSPIFKVELSGGCRMTLDYMKLEPVYRVKSCHVSLWGCSNPTLASKCHRRCRMIRVVTIINGIRKAGCRATLVEIPLTAHAPLLLRGWMWPWQPGETTLHLKPGAGSQPQVEPCFSPASLWHLVSGNNWLTHGIQRLVPSAELHLPYRINIHELD